MTGPAQRLQHDHRSPTRAGGAQSCAFYVDTVWETACIPTSVRDSCAIFQSIYVTNSTFAFLSHSFDGFHDKLTRA